MQRAVQAFLQLHLRLINLFNGLAELTQMFYLLGYQFTVREDNRGAAEWKSGTGPGVRGGMELSWHPLPNLQVFTQPEALQTPSLWVLRRFLTQA